VTERIRRSAPLGDGKPAGGWRRIHRHVTHNT
jgi:hypothetical protein